MQQEKMKAVITTQYGNPEVLELQNINIPQPAAKEVLVKVKATSVTAAHIAMREGKPYFGRLFIGLRKPKMQISGTDFAGVVEAVGKEVDNFKLGDRVFGSTDIEGGAYAEYLCINEDKVILTIPDNLNFEEAAGIIDGASTALPFLQTFGEIKEGDQILINGASGGIGTAAVQLAKYYKAEVTGVCSTRNLEMVKHLGADFVVDYTKEDFTRSNKKYDIVFDTVGKSSFRKSKKVLKETGIYLSPVLRISMLFAMLRSAIFGKKKARFAATGLRKTGAKRIDFKLLRTLLKDSKLKVVVDRKYPIEAIREAHEYVGKGHKRGNVVLSIK